MCRQQGKSKVRRTTQRRIMNEIVYVVYHIQAVPSTGADSQSSPVYRFFTPHAPQRPNATYLAFRNSRKRPEPKELTCVKTRAPNSGQRFIIHGLRLCRGMGQLSTHLRHVAIPRHSRPTVRARNSVAYVILAFHDLCRTLHTSTACAICHQLVSLVPPGSWCPVVPPQRFGIRSSSTRGAPGILPSHCNADCALSKAPAVKLALCPKRISKLPCIIISRGAHVRPCHQGRDQRPFPHVMPQHTSHATTRALQ